MTKSKKATTLLCAISLVISSLLPSQPSLATTTQLQVDAPAHVVSGELFTIRVKASTLNSSGNRSRIDLSYPSNKVQAITTSVDGSSFGGNSFINNSHGSNEGRITHLAYPIPAPTGQDMLVLTATFSARETGNVTFNFDSISVVNDTIPVKNPKLITIVGKTCPAGQTGTPPNCTTPQTPNPTPTPTPSPTKPTTSKPATPSTKKPVSNTKNKPAQVYPGRAVQPNLPSTPLPVEAPAPAAHPEISTPDIVNQQVIDSKLDIVNLRTLTRLDRAEILWGVNHPAEMKFRYGPSTDKVDIDVAPEIDSDGQFYVNMRKLEPGKTYYYTIEGARTDGNEKMSHSGTFSTKGYSVEIKALQQDGSPLSDAQISFADTGGSVSTNSEGIAYIQVRDGEYNIAISKGGHSSTHKITIEKRPIDENGEVEPQKVEIKTSATSTAVLVEATREPPNIAAYIITIMVGIVVMAAIGFIIYVRMRRSENRRSNNQGVVVIDDGWMPPPS